MRRRSLAVAVCMALCVLLPLALPAATGAGYRLEPLVLNYSKDPQANVILIHGIRQGRGAWDKWKAYLEQDAASARIAQRVWTFEYPWGTVTAEQAAQELGRLLRQEEQYFRNRPLTLVGFSKGGLVAIHFAAAPERQVEALESRGIRLQDTTLIFLDAPLRGCKPLARQGLVTSDVGGYMTPAASEELRRGFEGDAPLVHRSYAVAPRGSSGVVARDSAFDSRLSFADELEVEVDTLRSEDPERSPFGEGMDDHRRTMNSRTVYRRLFGEVEAAGIVQPGWVRFPSQWSGGTLVRGEVPFFVTESVRSGGDDGIGVPSAERQHFLDCYTRNGGRATVGLPRDPNGGGDTGTRWWGSSTPVVVQHFEGGSEGRGAILDNEGTAHELAFWIHGEIWRKYVALGGPDSALGRPQGDESEAAPSPHGTHGRLNRFDGGSIYWSPRYGAHPVDGAIGKEYEARGGTLSPLGFPTTDPGVRGGEARDGNLVQQDFEGGTVATNAAGTVAVRLHSDPGAGAPWQALLIVGRLDDPALSERERRLVDFLRTSADELKGVRVLSYHLDRTGEGDFCRDRLGITEGDLLVLAVVEGRGSVPERVLHKVCGIEAPSSAVQEALGVLHRGTRIEEATRGLSEQAGRLSDLVDGRPTLEVVTCASYREQSSMIKPGPDQKQFRVGQKAYIVVRVTDAPPGATLGMEVKGGRAWSEQYRCQGSPVESLLYEVSTRRAGAHQVRVVLRDRQGKTVLTEAHKFEIR